MTRDWTCINTIVFLAAAVCGLAADTPPAFDVVDIHVSGHVTNPYMRGGVLRGGRYDVRTASMVDLISAAYGMDGEKVQGGPSWLDTDRFDISAKAPANTSPETVKLMLQTLLADRFKLKIHTDSKPMPAYVLTLGKGKPKLKESDGSANSRCQGQPQNPQPGAVPYNMVSCRNRSMEQLAQDLRNMAGAYLSNPVVDQTGLKGTWDFDLKWTGRNQLAAAGADGISIFDAVEKQLGLKLEPQKVATPVIVVDSVNQKPTENPPGVTSSLPPAPPPEFEVATIKASMPGATNVMGKLEHGRLDVQNFPLKNLILIAWDLSAEELLAGAPKFLDSARFDITAKAPTPAPGAETDMEDLRLMVRASPCGSFQAQNPYGRAAGGRICAVCRQAETSESGSIEPYWMQGRSRGGRKRPADCESRAQPADDLPEHDHGAICGSAAKLGERVRPCQRPRFDRLDRRLRLHVEF